MLLWCAETTIVTAVLAVLALAIGRHRSVSPSVRHAFWLVVLIKFVTPPLVSWPWAVDVRSLEWPAAWQNAAAPAVVAQQPLRAAIAGSQTTEIKSTDGWSGIDQVPQPADDSVAAVQLAAALPAPRTDKADAPAAGRPIADVPVVARDVLGAAWRQFSPRLVFIKPALLIAWLSISVAIACGQTIRIIRFRRRLRGALAVPDFLIDEADRIGHLLGVTVPELLMVDDLGTPLLWCLGRPQLLLPTRLVKTLPAEQWRGILTHELAHLRRHDHWVSRIELATGLVWWWNPVYWLTRGRLDAEAELACDAWVVWALPKDRLSYAEVLFDICSTMSRAKPMAPTLSVVGSGRFFERRLTMILHDRIPCRLSPLGLVAACFLLLAALPSWSAAQLVNSDEEVEAALAIVGTPPRDGLATTAADNDDRNNKAVSLSADDDDDDANDDDDDVDDDENGDDQDAAALARAKARADAAQARVEAARARVEALERRVEAARARNEKALKSKDKAKASKGKVPSSEGDVSGLEKELESKFGEDSEFAKRMEKLGKDLEAKFGSGSEFEKTMEKLGETIGKEMEGKLGPGSDFEKQMKKLGKEMEAKFGEGSEFAEKMKGFGKEMESKFGPGSEFEQKMKKLGEEMKAKQAAHSELAEKLAEKAASPGKAGTGARGEVKGGSRERQIEKLEAQVAELMEQIKALKAQRD
jgi:beta-lactamase regulating signal transducer with metallopeptidase domain